MSKKDSDHLNRSFSLTMEGIGFDSMVEEARLNAARHFEVPASRIYVKAGNYRPGRISPFRQNLGVKARPETWMLDVHVGVKERDDDE